MVEQLRITFCGQSGFRLQLGSSTMIIDPGNRRAGDTSGQLVYCTHSHFDHTGGVEAFLERNSEAILVGNEQIAHKFKKWNERVITVIPGETFEHDPWRLEFIECRHGLFRNVLNVGVVVRTPNTSFGHVGDAITFQGFYGANLDILAHPISGMFAASPKRAISELKQFARPLPVLIIMHWLWRNPKKFCKELEMAIPDTRCIVPVENEEMLF
jgi:L-ascorbate metabolism protein UlaG (beta-lactamase superfamily)